MNNDWIYDVLLEMVKKLLPNETEISDDVSDMITDYANQISDGVNEGYFASGDYVADCNLKENKITADKREVYALKLENEALRDAIRSKGFEFYFDGKSVHEVGMEHIGGTISASYDRVV